LAGTAVRPGRAGCRRLVVENKITWPLGSIGEPATCDDVNFGVFVYFISAPYDAAT
jgi:hypothetical protein